MAESNKRRSFYIPRVGDERPSKPKPPVEIETEEEVKERKFVAENFVSPYYGRNVKDENVYPYVKYNNDGSQYESLRDRRLRSDEESKRKYGHKYYEFSQVIQSNQTLKSGEAYSPSLDERNPESTRDYEEVRSYDNDRRYESPRTRENTRNYEEVRGYDNNRYYEEDNPEVDYSTYEEPNNEELDYYEEIAIERTPEPPKPRQVAPQRVINEQPKEKAKTEEVIEIDTMKVPIIKNYKFPQINLLKKGRGNLATDTESINLQRKIIDNTLRDFKIGAQVVHYSKGPTVTQFEVKVDPGVNVDRVKSVAKNLQMNLAVRSIRIQAPIPGKAAVGIEVPNKKTDLVLFGDLLDNSDFINDGNPLNVVLGLDLSGKPIYADIGQMPHGLIAGATGSGKSVCINAMIISMLYKAHPDDLKMILIDPKVVEFSSYEDIPHLATPIITDPKLATASLRWAVEEMENRYQLFKHSRVRDIKTYNEVAAKNPRGRKLPYIVIIIDELADLMSVASSDVEDYIRRIAQKARAAGIHLIVATQRPSTDIIKGTIKANIPTRIAFAVSSQVDSITILDKSGAEKLLGRGDMLFNDGIQERRVQGAYISFEEIVEITNYIRDRHEPNFIFTEDELKEKALASVGPSSSDYDATFDEYFPVVARFIVENDSASINRVQKTFSIGFNRAQAIMSALETLGVVSENLGSRPREVLVTLEELEEILADI